MIFPYAMSCYQNYTLRDETFGYVPFDFEGQTFLPLNHSGIAPGEIGTLEGVIPRVRQVRYLGINNASDLLVKPLIERWQDEVYFRVLPLYVLSGRLVRITPTPVR